MALILIADPLASERQRLRHMIESQDHVIVEADNSAYCLEIAEYHSPQCVVLNPLLLDQADPDLLQALQKLGIPTVLLNADAQIKVSQQGQDWPAFTALDEDSDQADLLHTLAKTLTLDPELQLPLPPEGDGGASALSSPEPTPSSVAQTAQPPPEAALEHNQRGPALLNLDQLQFVLGKGISQAADILNQLTDCPLTFQPPIVENVTVQSVQTLLRQRFRDDPICATQLPFEGGLAGIAQLFFPQNSALYLTAALTGEPPESPGIAQLREDALTEVGNIVLNSVMGEMGNILEQSLSFSVPIYLESVIADLTQSLAQEHEQTAFLLAQTRFMIEDLQIQGDIILFFKMP